MALPKTTKAHFIAHKPTKDIAFDGPNQTFALKETELPEIKDGQVLVELLYLSNDPAQRGWIDANQDPKRLYVPAPQIGDIMPSGGIGKVLASKNSAFPEGSIVQGFHGWAQHRVVTPEAAALRVIQEIPGVSLTHYLGALGLTGLTAYCGLVYVGKATKEDVLVVSGAAGATGSMVVQIAKHIVGCKKIIGLAGSDEKCKWVESLGADVCINYKKDWEAQLKEAIGDDATLYFDNVGGEQLDFMLGNLAKFGRVVACGAIADYNADQKYGVKRWLDIITMRLQINGFIVLDYADKYAEMIGDLVKSVKEGKITVSGENETVVETKFEDIPKTFIKLFVGGNQGKLVTKIV